MKALSNRERYEALKLLDMLLMDHDFARVARADGKDAGAHEWHIAKTRQDFFKLTGITLTDENDWTMARTNPDGTVPE